MTVIELSSLKKPFCHFYKSQIHSSEKKAITLHLKLSITIGVAHFFKKSNSRSAGHRAVKGEHFMALFRFKHGHGK
jgi:hypothetical protein